MVTRNKIITHQPEEDKTSPPPKGTPLPENFDNLVKISVEESLQKKKKKTKTVKVFGGEELKVLK